MAMLELEPTEEGRGADSPDPLGELLRQLEGTLQDAVGLLAGLEEGQGGVAAEVAAESGDESGAEATRAQGIERRLAMVEGDRRELTTRLVDSERRASRLMTLYVATYHLHAELDPAAVLGAIAEIAVDLLGARRFALLLRDGETCRLELARGGAEGEEIFRDGRYRGGDPMLDATLADGVLRLAPAGEPRVSRALAAVPLNRGDDTAGVLALLELFEQKEGLSPEDRDLLDLLAAHAASALTAAELFASKDRRLRTFESLVRLVRGSAPGAGS
ncbi:MAG TPA: GAF domain-containing protein [Thermoanaerobaculia bacterium]|nr:GAF domain-containing protein [Thermoanaerobaculia bacterium]